MVTNKELNEKLDKILDRIQLNNLTKTTNILFTTKEFHNECNRVKDGILDEIKSDIEEAYCKVIREDYDKGRNYGLYMAMQIIDKYKTERS